MLLFLILITFTEQTNVHILMLFCQGHYYSWEICSCTELDPAQNETVMLHAFPHLTEQQKCKTLPLVTVDGIVSCGDHRVQVWHSQKSVFTFPLYCPFLTNASYFNCAADFNYVKNRTDTLSLFVQPSHLVTQT